MTRMAPRSLLVPPGRARLPHARAASPPRARAGSRAGPGRDRARHGRRGEHRRRRDLERRRARGRRSARAGRGAAGRPSGRPSPGEHVLCCRARDDAGNEQPLEPPWNVGGYANNAVHRVPVVVCLGSRPWPRGLPASTSSTASTSPASTGGRSGACSACAHSGSTATAADAGEELIERHDETGSGAGRARGALRRDRRAVRASPSPARRSTRRPARSCSSPSSATSARRSRSRTAPRARDRRAAGERVPDLALGVVVRDAAGAGARGLGRGDPDRVGGPRGASRSTAGSTTSSRASTRGPAGATRRSTTSSARSRPSRRLPSTRRRTTSSSRSGTTRAFRARDPLAFGQRAKLGFQRSEPGNACGFVQEPRRGDGERATELARLQRPRERALELPQDVRREAVEALPVVRRELPTEAGERQRVVAQAADAVLGAATSCSRASVTLACRA